MSIRVLAIINPTSGKGNIKNYINEIRKNLEEQNMQVNIQLTKKEYNARNIVIDYIEETDLTLYKEQGFLTKLFNLIKGIFKKK